MKTQRPIQMLLQPATLLAVGLLPVLCFLGNPAIALLCGAALTLTLNRDPIPGSRLLGRYSLQTAIVLLGLKLNAGLLAKISADYSLIVSLYVLMVIGGGLLIGRWLNTTPVSSQLISSGTAICGGTTIASLSPVINARPEETGVALTLVFLMNALALFTFPWIGHALMLSQEQFGLWVALAIHDTSSVVATAALYGEEAATIATTVKLGRTLWLIPLLLAAAIARRSTTSRVRLPWFVALFVLSACAGSVVTIPVAVVDLAGLLSKLLLVVALYCIGTEINRGTLRRLNGAVVRHALLLWLTAAPAVLALVYFFV